MHLSHSVSNAETKKCMAAVFSSTRNDSRPNPFMTECSPCSSTSQARGGRRAPSIAPIIPALTAPHQSRHSISYAPGVTDVARIGKVTPCPIDTAYSILDEVKCAALD